MKARNGLREACERKGLEEQGRRRAGEEKEKRKNGVDFSEESEITLWEEKVHSTDASAEEVTASEDTFPEML